MGSGLRAQRNSRLDTWRRVLLGVHILSRNEMPPSGQETCGAMGREAERYRTEGAPEEGRRAPFWIGRGNRPPELPGAPGGAGRLGPTVGGDPRATENAASARSFKFRRASVFAP